ncbi:uncharacterized protein LOC121987870 [Zingiber officinale]|uniref:uncharacterized protein LOC121987870 n=1 Tax=Zingiber officinale TaxID=94328 RepID=UPI001C4C5816|nr:uncharacterized protein LOC121987870 [Zingiber officinale]
MGKAPATARQTKAAKLRKLPPVKVVHISNPMRVTTSAAKFRGLVQRLTGRHSNVADMVFDHSSVFLDGELELQQQSYVSSSLTPAATSGADNYYGGATATDPYVLGVLDLDRQALGVRGAGGFWRQFGA